MKIGDAVIRFPLLRACREIGVRTAAAVAGGMMEMLPRRLICTDGTGGASAGTAAVWGIFSTINFEPITAKKIAINQD